MRDLQSDRPLSLVRLEAVQVIDWWMLEVETEAVPDFVELEEDTKASRGVRLDGLGSKVIRFVKGGRNSPAEDSRVEEIWKQLA